MVISTVVVAVWVSSAVFVIVSSAVSFKQRFSKLIGRNMDYRATYSRSDRNGSWG